MSAIRVKTHVPESRQVTITLPPGTPVGDAELEITVCEPMIVFDVILPPDTRPKVFPTRPTHPELAAEFDAFEQMLPDLMKQYAGKYIALHKGAVAFADSEVGALTAAHHRARRADLRPAHYRSTTTDSAHHVAARNSPG